MALPHPLYPVGLVIAGRACLVVGGGEVGGRKAAGLAHCGARVTLVAPEVAGALGVLRAEGVAIAPATPDPSTPPSAPGAIVVCRRAYRTGEAARYWLVIAATGRREVDRAVQRDAEAGRVWVNCVDDGAHCSVVLPAVHRDGAVTLAVSTGGSSPALASWLRSRLADGLGESVGDLAALLDCARQALHRAGRSTEGIDWAALLDGPLPDLVRRARTGEARALLAGAVGLTAVELGAADPRPRPSGGCGRDGDDRVGDDAGFAWSRPPAGYEEAPSAGEVSAAEPAEARDPLRRAPR